MSNESKIFPKTDFPIILQWRGAATMNIQTFTATDGMLVRNMHMLSVRIEREYVEDSFTSAGASTGWILFGGKSFSTYDDAPHPHPPL